MNNKKNVAIIGTVGIPACYGGSEFIIEHLTEELNTQFNITVYCSSKNYSEKLDTYKNAKLEYVSLKANGWQSIIYDIISLIKASKKSDVILIFGVSGMIFLPFYGWFCKKRKLIINIDGLEHRRDKWNKFIQKYLKFSEKLAIKYGDIIIGDNQGIKDYVKQEYNYDCQMIAYGADNVIKEKLTKDIKEKYEIPNEYAFSVCRIEPENNIHIILEAFKDLDYNLVIIGNWHNSDYGKRLLEQYKHYENFYLLQPIYDQQILNSIRSNCKLYIHGHSAGGTNPSLVEAMYLKLPILAYSCNYNKYTTFNKALYFENVQNLRQIIIGLDQEKANKMAEELESIAHDNYTWKNISEQYAELFLI